MGNPAVDALSFIISVVFDLYAMIVAVRFLMQALKADYFNPLAQFVVTATDPVLKPLRRLIPGLGGYDIASLLLCLGVIILKLIVLTALSYGIGGATSSIGSLVTHSIIEMIGLFFNIFIYSMIIMALLSWIVPDQAGNPVISLLRSLTNPILRPVRRFVPPMGGLDLSVFVAIVGMMALKILTMGTLSSLIGA